MTGPDLDALAALADEWERKYADHIAAAVVADGEVVAGLQMAAGSVRKLCAAELRAALGQADGGGSE